MRVNVDRVSSVTEAEVAEVWPVYDAVFGDQPDVDTWRATVWDRHVVRYGFRLSRAYDGHVLVGFAYGYTGRRGQWWTDRAAQVLDPVTADTWLDGHFELVSIAVLPPARGRGVGAALLAEVTRDLPHERWLLMSTADETDPARRLYARAGWSVIGPGLRADQVILGRRRP